MESNRLPIFVPPLIKRDPGTTVRLAGREVGGAYCVCEMTTMPGDGVPLHVQRDEELYYILEGVLEMVAGERRISAAAESLIVIPPGVPHSFQNTGDTPVRALMLFRPGGFDEMLGDLREAEKSGSLGDEERSAILARWGVRFL